MMLKIGVSLLWLIAGICAIGVRHVPEYWAAFVFVLAAAIMGHVQVLVLVNKKGKPDG